MQKLSVLVTTIMIMGVIGQINFAEAKKVDKVTEVTIDCSVPNTNLQNEIDNSFGVTVITFSGVCVGDLEIIVDDLTLEGETPNATVDGSITVIGARRVTLDAFTLAGSVSGNTGLLAVDGAAVRVAGLLIDGDLGGSDLAVRGVGVFHGAIVRIFDSTIQNTQTGVLAFGGSVAEVRDSSVVDLFTDTGVSSEQGSSVRIIDSTVTMEDGSNLGASVGRNSTLTVQNSTITASATTLNSTNDDALQLREGSFARIEDSTIEANSDINAGTAAINILESNLRLRGANTVSNSGGGFAVNAVRGVDLLQNSGHADVNGFVQLGMQSRAEFQNTTISGDVSVFENSLLRLSNRSGVDAQETVDGNVALSLDSSLTASAFGGGLTVRISGNVSCDDAESSFEDRGVTVVGGSNTCSGF